MSNSEKNLRRNILILSSCQALAMTGASLIITMAALAGQMLAEDKSLATLPIACQFIATMTMTIPASLMMGKFGRKIGFTIGQLLGFIGALTAAYAIYHSMFWLFMCASTLIGTHNAFWQYYRFAAGEVANANFKSRAISYVLAGGVISAIVGPQLARLGYDLFSPVFFMGGYVIVSGLCVIAILSLQFIKIPHPSSVGISFSGRPLLDIVRQPLFLFAVISSMFGYATELRSMTQGRAVFTMQFSHYEKVPQNVQDEVTKKIAG